jgi:diaminopimelate decarboxylase
MQELLARVFCVVKQEDLLVMILKSYTGEIKMEAHFILSKKVLKKQVKTLEDLGLKVSYSYKTNRIAGDVLQEICPEVDYSIHAKEEIEKIKDKSKISFFTQAESVEELEGILKTGVRSFVIDNLVDLDRILEAIKKTQTKINLSLRMKFQDTE